MGEDAGTPTSPPGIAYSNDANDQLEFLQLMLWDIISKMFGFKDRLLNNVSKIFEQVVQFISFWHSVGGVTYFALPVIAAIGVVICGILFARHRRRLGEPPSWPLSLILGGESTKKTNLFSQGRLGYGYGSGNRAGAAHISVVFAYRGTIIPRVIKQVILSALFAYFLCYLWHPVKKSIDSGDPFRLCSAEKGTCWSMDPKVTKIVYYLFVDADQAFKYLTPVVTFILGFYNSSMYSRWWKLRSLAGDVAGRSVDTMVFLQAYMTEMKHSDVRQANEDRKALVRYLGLAQALSLQAAMREGGKDLEMLCARGLLDRNSAEYRALQDIPGSGYNEVYGWFLHRFQTSCLHKYVHKDLRGHVLTMVQTNITKVRGAAADAMMYLNEPMPLAYRHLLELLVLCYMFVTPIALVPQLLWVAPFVVVMVVVFVAGFLELSTSVMNDPFRDPDGFLVDQFLDGQLESSLSAMKHIPPSAMETWDSDVLLMTTSTPLPSDIEMIDEDHMALRYRGIKPSRTQEFGNRLGGSVGSSRPNSEDASSRRSSKA